MTTLATRIVDRLTEGFMSDEDMEGFGDAASYVFNWTYTPHANEAPAPAGSYRLNFKILNLGAQGEVYVSIGSSAHSRRNLMQVNFSVNVSVSASPRAANHASSRLKLTTVEWKGEDAMKNEFEDFIRDSVTRLLKAGRLTNTTLSAAVRKFVGQIEFERNIVGKATPEEVAALKIRFNHGETEKRYKDMGMFNDPRIEGVETSYEFITSNDVRFWNRLADEYDARAT